MTIYGDRTVAQFARKHAAARKPLSRFLDVARLANWSHFPAVKKTFAATDYAAETGTLIFDIGGNKYRLVARVDFEQQILSIQSVMTHREYARKDL